MQIFSHARPHHHPRRSHCPAAKRRPPPRRQFEPTHLGPLPGCLLNRSSPPTAAPWRDLSPSELMVTLAFSFSCSFSPHRIGGRNPTVDFAEPTTKESAASGVKQARRRRYARCPVPLGARPARPSLPARTRAHVCLWPARPTMLLLQVFVGNLPDGVTEERLRETFAPFGEVRVHGSVQCSTPAFRAAHHLLPVHPRYRLSVPTSRGHARARATRASGAGAVLLLACHATMCPCNAARSLKPDLLHHITLPCPQTATSLQLCALCRASGCHACGGGAGQAGD